MATVLALVGVLAGFFLCTLRTDFYVQSLQAKNTDPAGYSSLTGALNTFPDYLSQRVGILGWIFLIVGLGWAWYIPHERSAPK